MGQSFRIVTGSSLFDGHDASINVFRRLLQKAGMEVIHLGHNRSVDQFVTTALQEDADAVCVSSYQGGHMEYFKYMVDQLQAKGLSDVQVFGGGGGTILPSEIKELEAYGVSALYHAEDGRQLGLDGIIEDLVGKITPKKRGSETFGKQLSQAELARAITALEEGTQVSLGVLPQKTPIVGITGTGGAGKSSLIDELITRFLATSPEGKICVVAFDPTKRKTGGALLGDRIRMNSVYSEQVFLRSMGTRGSGAEMGKVVKETLDLCQHGGFDLIILETSGIGQGGSGVVELCDLSLYVMTSEYGASTQLEKIDMIDFADLVAVNKFDKMGAEDALADVRYQYADSRGLKYSSELELPVFGTIASNFNDPAVSSLFQGIVEALRERDFSLDSVDLAKLSTLVDAKVFGIIPPERTHYLAEVAEAVANYKGLTEREEEKATHWQHLKTVAEELPEDGQVQERLEKVAASLDASVSELIDQYRELCQHYQQEEYCYDIRGKRICKKLTTESLSGTKVPKIAVPQYRDYGQIYRFMRMENFPGHFPFTAGVFPLKSDTEDPKRMFAGEGGPGRTNQRFHYLCAQEKAKRLSTAFDSVTLYGEDPAEQMDIYGKVGNSGVSIATLDHMKTLYKGFDLADPLTSVSLTINGPAPMILAMFLNAAIDFEMEKSGGEYEAVRDAVLERVRGTVQADILKEEQGQNTCIFSSKFAVKMMGDIQEYFIKKRVRNFYSVSISGYHIAEAGANPITQLAFTLANAFTYVEYYLSRGMPIDAFAPNLSFFFSAGLDPEYSVLGRVARRIWAVAMRDLYGAGERSCKLKYHIQTSGRSLHAQEIAFNDIRTTLQALMSIYDHCNSLHTNAYDEAITTPTEESVRRAMAIQLIILKEMGVAKCENPMQGSFIQEQLTDLVEEAVLAEFRSIARRGGVLGAMEKQYQRHQIQTESMKYEQQKSSGELPLIGVNTFLGPENEQSFENLEVIRATEEEKQEQIASTRQFIERAGEKNGEALRRLEQVVLSGGNIFEELMECVKYASLGQITSLLYRCGGEYRRSM